MFNIALRKKIKVLVVTCVLYGFSIPSALAVTTIGNNINTAGNVTLSAGNLTVTTGTLTVGGNVSLSGGADISLIPVSNGNVTIGGAVQSGTIFIGTSTVTNSINIGNAITEAGFTQTINVGTAGAANSATTIGIGSGSGTSTITIGNSSGASSVAINSSDWKISTTGLMEGIGNINTDGNINTSAATFNIANGTSTAINVGGAATTVVLSGLTIGSSTQLFTLNGSTTIAGLLTGNGQFVLGDNGDTGAINTSDWKVSTTGLMEGIGNINTDGNINTTAATFNIANGTSTTINMGGATTAINIGTTTGTTTIIFNSGVLPSAQNSGFQIGSQKILQGNLFAYGTSSYVPTFTEYILRDTDGVALTQRGAIGMLSTGEMNTSINMDYTTSKHLPYDTTKVMSWFAFAGGTNPGLFWQYVPANQTPVADYWNTYGATPFQVTPYGQPATGKGIDGFSNVYSAVYHFADVTNTSSVTSTEGTIWLSSGTMSILSVSGIDNRTIAGYVGASNTQAQINYNLTAGIGTSLKLSNSFTFPLANSGNDNFSIATTTGYNIGSYNEALGGIINVGTIGKSITAKNSGSNIGVIGVADNSGSSPTLVGGYFGLGGNATPTFTSTALMADNGATTSNIFVARDNGTAVFTIADGGKASLGTSTAPTYAMDVFSTGTTTLLLDSVSTTQGSCVLMQAAGTSTLVGIYITQDLGFGTTTSANCT